MSFLTQLAEFAGTTVVSRELTFRDKTETFHFRELSAAESEDLFIDAPTDGQKSNKGFRSRVISAVMCDLNGKPVLSIEQAAGLKNAVSNLLVHECLEVNAMTDESKEEAGNAQ